MAMAGCITPVTFDDVSSVTTAPPKVPVVLGKRYEVGEVLIDNKSGVEIVVLPFQWPIRPPPQKLEWDYKGCVKIVPTTKAGGSGNEIHFNNACLGIIAPKATTITKLKVITESVKH